MVESAAVAGNLILEEYGTKDIKLFLVVKEEKNLCTILAACLEGWKKNEDEIASDENFCIKF